MHFYFFPGLSMHSSFFFVSTKLYSNVVEGSTICFCAFKNSMMDIKVNFRVLYWVDQNVSASYIFGCWVLCEIFSLCGGRNIFRNFETISLDLAGREERWNRADGIIFTRVESRSPKIDRLRVDSIILQYSKETKTNTEFYFTKYSILQR